MTIAEEEQIESCLRDTLTRTTDWVKFAETKNAALLTFASAWLLALGNMALGPNAIPAETRLAIGWAAPFVFAGAVCAIISIMPRLSWMKGRPADPNLLFYDHVHAKDGKTLLAEFNARYAIPEDGKFSVKYLEDLADQLAKNSGIASRKFRMFAWGASCVLASIFIFFFFTYGRALLNGLCGSLAGN